MASSLGCDWDTGLGYWVNARVAKQADAGGLNPPVRENVWVQIPPRARVGVKLASRVTRRS